MLTRHRPAASFIEFADYLQAKFRLDERSLNTDVRQACFERLATKRGILHCLDVGSGTGAMLRRLIEGDLATSLAITALDRNQHLLNVAAAAVTDQLQQRGYSTCVRAGGIDAGRADRTVRAEFQCRDFFDHQPQRAARYDLITAASFMDIVPIPRALSLFSSWLSEEGLLYATFNYDGDTALFPLYRDPVFEAAVLAEYDASMDRRRVLGEPTGGARSGRRLHSLLLKSGFDVTAYGSSDWNITPAKGRYCNRDADVLRALLAMVYGESENQPLIDRGRLTRWYGERSAQIETAELGMIVHQLDMLASRRQGRSALT